MVVGFYLPPTSAQATAIQGQPWYRDAMVPEINAWLTIAPVKGLGLVARDEILLEPHGVSENRRFDRSTPLLR